MRKILAVAIALTLAFTLASCGASGGASDGASGEGSTGPSSDGGDDAEVADLTAKALGLDDLPAGWAEDNSADDDDEEDSPLDCLEEAEGSFLEGKVGDAEVSFIQGTSVPQLEQNLAQYEVAGRAAELISKLDEVFDGCGAFEYEDDGETVSGQIGKVSLPEVAGADEQANYQLTLESEGFTISAGILLLSKADYATMIILLDLGSFDTDQLVELGELALGKL